MIEDINYRFIECLGPEFDNGDKGQRYIGQNPPIYVRFPASSNTSFNAFIPIENLREAISSSERVYCLVPLALGDGSGVQASLSHTVSDAVRRGEADFVAANHCQRGSNVLLYKFVRCRYVRPRPSPSRRSPSPSRRSPSSSRRSPSSKRVAVSPSRRSPPSKRVAVSPSRRSARRPCPVGMLWNPRTQRCIKDTPENRRRLGRNARR